MSDFAAQYVSKGRERIVHGFVVNGFVQVLDEDIANSGATEAGIALAPHNSDGFALQDVEIHGIKGSFSVGRLLEIHVSVSQRHPGDHVPADSNGEDGSGRGELFKKHGLGDIFG